MAEIVRFLRLGRPVRPLAHDQWADLTFQHLLHQVVGIDDLADLRHLAVAESVEHGHVDLNDAVVAALPEEHAQIGRDRVALGDDLRHLVADLGVALLHGAPELAKLLLAVAGAHVRQHIDRRVGEEVDVVGAAR